MNNFSQLIELILPAHPPSYLHLKILLFLLYLAVMRLIMLVPDRFGKRLWFATANIAAVALLYKIKFLPMHLLLTYLAAVAACYILTRLFAQRNAWLLATLAPIALLAAGRYAPPLLAGTAVAWPGLSYMAFRLSQLVVIVRNGITPMPGILDYLGFAFFAPTVLIGPISSYSTFHNSFTCPDHTVTPTGRCLLRILIGASKLLLFAAIFDRLSYRGLMLDGHSHSLVDLLVAAVAYYLYLYFNFSGFCDVAIGSAGVMGIKVSENFDFPFAARNMREYWNRWHITLSAYMRDMFFAPVSKALVQRLPQKLHQHAIALTVALVFLLIGIWHGTDMHYLLWGLLNGAGVVATFYWGNFLKRKLTREQLLQYNRNRWVHGAAVTVTFVFVCLTLFVFANSFSDMQLILASLR